MDDDFVNMVLEELESAMLAGEIYCKIEADSYSLHYENYGHRSLWNVSWHITKDKGIMFLGLLSINGTFMPVKPDVIFKLENIGRQVATMARMMA